MLSALAGTLSVVGTDLEVYRRGAPWTPQEITELIERIRAGSGRTDIARTHGRTPGALDAVAWRLLSADHRPEKKTRQAVELLRAEINDISAGAETDWWARYLEGRKIGNAAKPARTRSPQAPKTTATPKTPKPLLPLPECVQTFAEQPAIDWTQPGTESELGLLIVQVVNEIVDPRNRYIMARRLGLIDGSNTLESIGETLNLTRERVRQLQNIAITQVQHDAHRRGSAAATLAVVFNFLDKDPTAIEALAQSLLAAAQELFSCQPTWLIKSVSRMGGRTPRQADEIAAAAAAIRDAERPRRRELAHEQRQILTCDRIVDKWIHAATWPPHLKHADSERSTQRRRMPTPSGIASVGSFDSEKNGAVVHFESLLEESVFITAEGSDKIRTYQEQPCQIAYIGEDGQPHMYYPDLLLTLNDGRMLLVEVKPLWQMALTTNRIKCEAAQRYAAQIGWGWVSVGSSGQAYRDLEQRDISDLTRASLTAALNEGPVSWAHLQELRTQAPIAAMDVAAFAVQENIGLELFPYRLYHVSDV
ncbi:RNA polymerase sigma factor RpoS [Mycobacteroides abscessus subsp. abscessus]|nr:RNA polymerase sigma factor RpoS [Mycobacteroides abscessus subsp. abscessus]